MSLNAQFALGTYAKAVDTAFTEFNQNNVAAKIWEHDHTVWKPEPTEITNRLGWLHSPETMAPEIVKLQTLVTAVRADGFTNVLLLGMGGSSLAPEVFYKTFGAQSDGLDLAIVDTTDADAIQTIHHSVDLAKTVFIVATKSGGTAETLSAFKYFYNQVSAEVGSEQAGKQFIAITDPGSKLVEIAQQYNFRETLINDPNIGGRYSVLSFFGLTAAALVGVDVANLLNRAATVAANSKLVSTDNVSAHIGLVMGELAKAGRDKVTFIASDAIVSFGDWVEQLIAESTGKDGEGILPVVGEPVLAPDGYGADRLFVYLKLEGDGAQDTAVSALAAAGHPVITLTLADVYDMGAQFFLWEFATAVAGYSLNIQPFDQPNVEAAKIMARKMVAAYMETGDLPEGEAAAPTPENLHNFLAQTKPGDYISIQAYVPATPETDQALAHLRTQLLTQYKLATTVGYGPRFLHSTGQLHKGDGGNGIFIQFTSDPVADIDIPDEAGKPESTMTFGVLKMSQALGDGAALLEANRRFIRFHLGTDAAGGINLLV